MTTALTIRRLVEEPELVSLVRTLEPRALGKMIEAVGLEDSGELISLATTAQLEQLLDDDLWKNERPGQDEKFDADRFALWLEVMLEAGEETVAERLSELPEDLLVLGLHRHLLVVDQAQLFDELSYGESDLLDKALSDRLSLELGDFLLISRTNEGWDAIVSALVALDQHHHDRLERILERCRRASDEQIEESGGLYRMLTSEELLELEASILREERRAKRGFVSPSSAAAFLEHARTTPLDQLIAARTRDPITKSYFRELGEPEQYEASKLIRILEQAGVLEENRPQRLLESGSTPFRRAMLDLFERDPEIYAQRMEELAFLANVLVAGGSKDGRRHRSSEAIETVLSACNLGLETIASGDDNPLVRESADKLFRIGWHLIHRGGKRTTTGSERNQK